MSQDEIQQRFSAGGAIESDILAELQSIMRIHDLSVEDLFYKWESYCIRLELPVQSGALTLGNVRNLKQNLQDELEKSHRSAQAPASARSERKVTATPRANGNSDVFGMLDSMVPSTPATGGKLGRSGGGSSLRKKIASPHVTSSPAGNMGDQLSSMNGTPSYSFVDRPNAGETVEVLNERLAAAEPPIAPYSEPRIKLTAASDQKKMTYKPLALKLSEASEILDDRIDDFMMLVQQEHGLDESVFGSAASQSTTEVVAVGRIASDALEGKLNAASLVLETSRRVGQGFRVPLKMDAIKSWSVFPGQIVALRGTNATGLEFTVQEVLEMPLLPNAATDTDAIGAHRQRFRGEPDAMDSDSEPAPINILYASGPFTADDNLDYEPLHALCSQAADTFADAVVLTGPFLDIDHPLIATGDFDLPEEANFEPDTATMNTVFKYLFSPALNRLASANPNVTIILIPSVRDILDKHVSWPQDTIVRKELGLPKNARIVSNPMTLFINEMLLGASSQDVLYELRNEELSKTAQGEIMSRLCRHLIEQRHYFPVFPPTDRTRLPKTGAGDGTATGAMLDVSYLKLGEMVNVRPDVMLVPSALPPFARVVESVVAINPGFLSKRRGPGTYARMTLHAPKIEAGDASGLQRHSVFNRARVEIVRV